MNKINLSLLFLSFIWLCNANAQKIERDSLFNSGWKFYRGIEAGAENPDFDDKTWRTIDLPHDWSIEDLPSSYQSQILHDTIAGNHSIISGPFDSDAIGGANSGYTIGGTGWYRKHFRLPKAMSDKIVTICFDGVYMNADVWINGHHLGNHPYGYTAFWFDLSDYLNYEESENVIAVEVKNEGVNSRWYSGSGIYRHVYLSITDKIHVEEWGTFVSTTSADSLMANINIKSTVNNKTSVYSDISVIYTILDGTLNKIATKKLSTRISKSVPSVLNVSFEIPHPDLWSPETPVIYKAICEIVKDDKIIDRTETNFGIRSIKFDSEKGFILNGKKYKLKGGSLHANNGPLGAVANDRAEERRVELMKSAGFNAIRCGHNPPSAAFLDVCDRLGMLVIDEAFDVWVVGWLPDDYHVYFNDWWKKDITSMVHRDRNHPSVFAWSIENQGRENSDSVGIALAYEISGFVRSLDPSRAVTANIIVPQQTRNAPLQLWSNCDPYFAALNICGYSYQSANYESDHQRLPNRIMYSSEIDPRNSFNNWMKVEDLEYVLGNFEWTAMDFMGEVSLGWWGFNRGRPATMYPWQSTYSGDFDLCGYKRPRSYYRDVLFKYGCKLSVFVYSPVPSFEGTGDSRWGWDDVKQSWTWPGNEGKSLSVVAYSGCDSVKLVLNGNVLGTQPTSRKTEFKAIWKVPYQKGTLTAIGYTNGKEVAQWKIISAGEPAKIRLTADRSIIRADGQDLSYITVEITDKNGILNPLSSNLVSFKIEGAGTIVAVGNSNPKSVESFQQPFRKAYEGRCLVIVRSDNKPGQIILQASGQGLTSGKIIINTENINNIH